MRARLEAGKPGENFRFLCDHTMAAKMDTVVARADGEILERDVRSYGVVLFVEKKIK